MSKCIYCNCQIDDSRAIDVCDMCGIKVWGDKMFHAIKQNMENARSEGNLNQGSICVDLQGKVKDCDIEGTFKVVE